MAMLFFIDGRVVAFVNTFVAVGDVTRRATLATIVTACFTPLDGDVTALALLALIGNTGQLGIFFDFFDTGVGNLREFGRELFLVGRYHVPYLRAEVKGPDPAGAGASTV